MRFQVKNVFSLGWFCQIKYTKLFFYFLNIEVIFSYQKKNPPTQY